jgi:hypothetical protein
MGDGGKPGLETTTLSEKTSRNLGDVHKNISFTPTWGIPSFSLHPCRKMLLIPSLQKTGPPHPPTPETGKPLYQRGEEKREGPRPRFTRLWRAGKPLPSRYRDLREGHFPQLLIFGASHCRITSSHAASALLKRSANSGSLRCSSKYLSKFVLCFIPDSSTGASYTFIHFFPYLALGSLNMQSFRLHGESSP